jgi:ribosomal protein S18 acetylase RimI-like enzyme
MRLGARRAPMPDRAFGSFELRRLDWDTAHFGQKMGTLSRRAGDVDWRAAALEADLHVALAEAADDGYAHVILRVPTADLRLARAAEESGMRLVDVAVDLVSPNTPSRTVSAATSACIRPARPSDIDSLRSIAEGSFELSRFAADPFFTSEQVAGFFRQWVTNLCDGLAMVVLVAEAADEVAGFTSCALQADGSGRIPLIATSDAYRRQGVGRALVEASLRWFFAEGIHTVWVKTQAGNSPALALYHRAGFRVGTAELTYSASLDHRVRAAV